MLLVGEVIIESVDYICRDGADTPISPIQTKRLETPERCSSEPFRHISVSMDGYIPKSTLKGHKIHHYSDIQKFAQTPILHLLLLLLERKAHTIDLQADSYVNLI